MLLLVLLKDHVPHVQEVSQPHVLLPRVLKVSILLLIMDVLNVLQLVLQLNTNQHLVRQLRIVFVHRVLLLVLDHNMNQRHVQDLSIVLAHRVLLL